MVLPLWVASLGAVCLTLLRSSGQNSSKTQEKNRYRWSCSAYDSDPYLAPHERTMVGSGHPCPVSIGNWGLKRIGTLRSLMLFALSAP